MSYTRKQFIRQLSLTSGALVLTPFLKTLALGHTKPLGIQLWTLKEDMLVDAASVIKKMGQIGYTYVENCELSKGLFWGYTPKEYKQICTDAGLSCVSSHVDIHTRFKQKVEQLASIGVQYVICPWLGPQKHIDDFKKAAAHFNELGRICQQHGLRFAYHNHDYSFKPLNNQLPQEVLLNETDPTLVDFEMDIYWVIVAGEDPAFWLKTYPNRFRLVHLKDRLKTAPKDSPFESCIIGTGSIDYRSMLPLLKEHKINYFIVEQEKFTEGTPLYAAEENFKIMQTYL